VDAAVNLPMELIRRDFAAPILVTVVTVIASIVVLGLSWLAFFPITFAARSPSPMRRRCTTWRSSSRCGRSSSTSTPSSTSRCGSTGRWSPRVKLLGSLPLINVITGSRSRR
jgi:hypothetical protein